MDLTIVIPAYNEADGIGPVLEQLAETMAASGIEHEIVVVDDGSADGTSDVIRDLAPKLPAVRVIVHPRNRGYGRSLKTGIHSAKAPIIAITDADGTYPNERIPEFFALMQGEENDTDMVVGARIGEHVHIPLIRRPAKAALRGLANYLSDQHIPDLNSGLRLFRRDAAIECFNLISDGFSFTTTITMSFIARHRHVVFEPIDYHQRTGSSKIRPFHDTFNFLVLILRVSVYFEPLRVFLPVSGVLALGGIAWGALQWRGSGGLGEAPVLLLVAALQILLVGLIADMISRKR